jgi:hypothetical protein
MFFIGICLISSCQSKEIKMVSRIFEESKTTIQINSFGSSSGSSKINLVFEKDRLDRGFINVTGSALEYPVKISEEELLEIRNLFTNCLESYSNPVENSVLINCEFSTEYLISGQEHKILVYDEYCSVKDALFEVLDKKN